MGVGATDRLPEASILSRCMIQCRIEPGYVSGQKVNIPKA